MAGYALADGVRALALGERNLLHHEHGQVLVELNATADRIWQALAASGSVSSAAGALTELSSAAALRMAEDCAFEWTRAGYLVPRTLDRALAGPPARTLMIDGIAVELRLDDASWRKVEPAFGHLCAAAAAGGARLSVLEHAGKLLVYLGRNLVLAGEVDGLAAHLKATITELYVDGVTGAFLAHAALLERDGRRLLLTGPPGAGKSTLTMALAAAGWRFGGDDIVRITPDGLVRAAPFAATIKSGSLHLLKAYWPQLAEVTAWRRADGQTARYWLPRPTTCGPGPIDAVVLLARSPGAMAAAAAISPVEALGALVEGGYARRWRMTGDALSALAETLTKACCLRLTYCDLPSAVRAVDEALGVTAQAA